MGEYICVLLLHSIVCWCARRDITQKSISAVQGGWADDVKQGLGKKVHSNGDVYEGLWRQGKCEGPGRYRWKNNNEYDGEWKAGRMHGRGTLKWHTGEAGLHTVWHLFYFFTRIGFISHMGDFDCKGYKGLQKSIAQHC